MWLSVDGLLSSISDPENISNSMKLFDWFKPSQWSISYSGVSYIINPDWLVYWRKYFLVCPWVSEVIWAEVETEWSGCSGDTWDMSVTGDDDTLSSDDCSSRTKHLRLVLLSCWDISPGKMSMSVRSEELTRRIIDIVSRSAPRQSVIDIQHIDYCKTFLTELSECENWS